MKKIPAFSRPISGTADEWSRDQSGMTLREYFAAHAPEMPDWFSNFNLEIRRMTIEQKFFAWRKFYAERMLETL